MLVFLSCQQCRRRRNPAIEYWEVYFKRGLEEAGHEWVEAEEIDWAEGLVPLEKEDRATWRQGIWPRVVDRIRKLHRQRPIDLFLGYLFEAQVEPEAIADIRALGIPCVNFFCDNVREFSRPPTCFACFDLHWVPEFKALDMYRRAGLPHVFAPMPTWVAPESRTWDHPERYGATFIGSRDIQREALFADVLRRGQPIELRGPGWNGSLSAAVNHRSAPGRRFRQQFVMIRDQGIAAWARKTAYRWRTPVPDATFVQAARPAVFGSDYVAVTQQSTITLGVNRYPSFHHPFRRPDTYSRLRDIEAPMLGACYLTEWTAGLDQMYELGTEIETYRDAEELIGKVRMLEAEPARRRLLRQRGQARALAEHTVGASIATISRQLGLTAPAAGSSMSHEAPASL